ncbi:MAG: hypothetical protein GY718_01845 [Lentisphaerae bacterium]|nr:hypothetical protein [Lentisphaerota bacterium]
MIKYIKDVVGKFRVKKEAPLTNPVEPLHIKILISRGDTVLFDYLIGPHATINYRSHIPLIVDSTGAVLTGFCFVPIIEPSYLFTVSG